MTAPTVLRKGQRAIGATLALLGLPVLLVLALAVSFRVANRPSGSFLSSGRKREYLLYVPSSYDRATPTALVISLHGAGLWGAAQKETSQWNRVADEYGFIVVYPSGEGGGGPRVWHEGSEAGPSRDVRFISELIDTLEARYNIDPRMIYANGLSNGGGMSFALSCTLSDRIAAVGVVGAALLLRDRRCGCSVQGRVLVGCPAAISGRRCLYGAVGPKKPLRHEAGRLRGRNGRHAPRIHAVR